MSKRSRLTPEQKLVLRDGAIFAVKLWLDGIKDVVFGFLALAAVVIDLIKPPATPQAFRFYKVMKLGHRIDHEIDVYGGHFHNELDHPKEPFDDLRG